LQQEIKPKMKKNLIAILLLITSIAFGQSKGKISGTVYDKEVNNEPLPFANVFIKGTNNGVTTEFDGTYKIVVEPGTYTLVFSFIGYETIEVTNTVVKQGETIVINKTMNASKGVSLSEIQISGSTKRESESILLTEQKKAVEIKQSIGADELARKGISDAATAITKISGISKEGSSNVYVRGLGDRYLNTSLNGLTMPSNDISKKNIDLDLFTSDVIENVSVSKAYAANFYGDFAAGNVNINSKDYTGNGFFEVTLESGINTNAISEKFVKNSGTGFFGFYGRYDHNPYAVVLSHGPDPISGQTPINTGISASGGKSFNVGNKGKFSFFLTGSFKNEYNFLQGVQAEYTNVLKKSFPYTDIYHYSTNTNVMANLNYRINDNNKLSFNSLFINSANDQVGYYGVNGMGTNRDAIADSDAGFYQMNSQFNQDLVFVNQLLGTHKINEEKVVLDWGIGYNNVYSHEPDRKRLSLEEYYNYLDNDPSTFPSFYTNNSFDNQRYFEKIIDEEINGRFNARINFSENIALNIGTNDRYKKRDFENIRYGYKNIDPSFQIDPKNFNEIFNYENWVDGLYETDVFRAIYPEGEGVFHIGPTNNPGLPENTYNAELLSVAGYASAEFKADDEKWLIVPGIRAEYFNQKIDYDVINLIVNPASIEVDENLYLPSLNVKYSLNDDMNLRFSYSNTVSIPEFKEVAPYVYEGVTERIGGNPDLLGHQEGLSYVNVKDVSYSDIMNIDLKYEWFMKKNEIISLGAFTKNINNPVNLVVANDATGTQRFFRTGDKATVYGLEFELKKNLVLKDDETVLSGGFNFSYTHTEQDLYSSIQGTYSTEFNRKTDQLQGSSPILLNADLNFHPNFGEKVKPTMNLVYSYFSDRIYALGSGQLGNKIEKGFSTLDFIWKNNFGDHFELNFRARNLLDASRKIIRETSNNEEIVLENFKYGMTFGLQFKYKL